MKLGFVANYDEAEIAFAASHGFDCLEVNAMPGSPLFLIERAGRIQEVARAFGRSGVRVSSLGLANNPLAPGQEGQEARQHYDWVFRVCEELGVDTIATSTGQDKGASLEENWCELAQVWTPIVAKAASKKIKVIFENCPHGYPTGMNLAIAPSFWRAIFQALPAPHVGLEYDPSHLVWQFVDYLTPIPEFGPRIIRVHAKDTEIDALELGKMGFYGRGWWRYRLPGAGQINWQGFFMKLREAGYDGDILIEHEDPVFEGPRRLEGLLIGRKFLSQFM
jgi:sugar phosphate isomerase/epimerase